MANNLWRYMDINKFELLLRSKSLYFCSAKNFDDKFECEYAWGVSGHKDYLKNIPKLMSKYAFPEMDRNVFMTMHLKDIKDKAKHSYVSCWNKNISESEAMWKLYCREISKGLVIKTDTDKLKSALSTSDKNIILKAVKYTPNFFVKNYNPEIEEMLCHKRSAFSYENEFRAFFVDVINYSKEPSTGQNIAIDINKLISEIRVSPFSSAEFKNEVKLLLSQYGIDIPVKSSEIKTHPILSVAEELIHKQISDNGDYSITSSIELKTKEYD